MKKETLTYMSWEDFIVSIIASVRDTGEPTEGTYKRQKKLA